MRELLAIAAVLVMTGACGAPESSRCEWLCARQAICEARTSGGDRDAVAEAECAQACSLFERDDEARSQVDERATCVEAADDCRDVLACAGEG